MSSSSSYIGSCVSISMSNNIQKRFYPGFFDFLKPGLVSKFLPSLTNKTPFSIVSWSSLHRIRLYEKMVSTNYLLNYNVPNTFYTSPHGETSSSLASLEKFEFLPLSYPRENYVSGLKSHLEVEKHLNNDEFTDILLTLLMKVIYNFAFKKYSTLEETIEEGLKNVFGVSKTLNMSFEIKGILEGKLISYLQHFIVIFWNDRKFTYTFLEKLCKDKIVCESYKNNNINILSLKELHVIHQFAKKVSQENNEFEGVFTLVNPEGFGNMPIAFCEPFSKDHTGQKHADCMVVKKINDPNSDKVYFDVKSFITTGFKYRRLALFHPNEKLLKQITNDFVNALKQYISEKKIKEESPIYQLYNRLYNIKKSNKNINEKYELMQKLFIQIALDDTFEELKVSILLDAGVDEEFSHMLETVFSIKLNEIKNNSIEYTRIKALIKQLFPEKPQINQTENANIVKEIITTVFPADYAKEILSNYEKLMIEGI